MAGEAALLAVVANFVVQFRAEDARRTEAHPELDALDRLQAHQRVRDAAVELAVPLHVAAEADRESARNHFHDAAESVAGLFAFVDCGDNPVLGGRVGNPHLRILCDAPQVLDTHFGRHSRLGPADADDVAEHGNAERVDKLLGEGADRDARGGLARRGALEHVADIVEIVLEHAGQIGVAGARARNRFRFAAVTRVDLLAPREVVIDARKVDFEAGRSALDCRDQFGAVGFASGKKTKHPYILYSRARAAHPGRSLKRPAFFKRCSVVAHRAGVLLVRLCTMSASVRLNRATGTGA